MTQHLCMNNTSTGSQQTSGAGEVGSVLCQFQTGLTVLLYCNLCVYLFLLLLDHTNLIYMSDQYVVYLCEGRLSKSLCVCFCLTVQFLESMQLNYDSQAADKGVYIIGSCGFDSIPSDMGVLYTKDQFKGMNIVTCTQCVYAHSQWCVHALMWYDSVIHCYFYFVNSQVH